MFPTDTSTLRKCESQQKEELGVDLYHAKRSVTDAD